MWSEHGILPNTLVDLSPEEIALIKVFIDKKAKDIKKANQNKKR